jgi:hypothetical protein
MMFENLLNIECEQIGRIIIGSVAEKDEHLK